MATLVEANTAPREIAAIRYLQFAEGPAVWGLLLCDGGGEATPPRESNFDPSRMAEAGADF
jgi:hypothetical protein